MISAFIGSGTKKYSRVVECSADESSFPAYIKVIVLMLPAKTSQREERLLSGSGFGIHEFALQLSKYNVIAVGSTETDVLRVFYKGKVVLVHRDSNQAATDWHRHGSLSLGRESLLAHVATLVLMGILQYFRLNILARCLNVVKRI